MSLVAPCGRSAVKGTAQRSFSNCKSSVIVDYSYREEPIVAMRTSAFFNLSKAKCAGTLMSLVLSIWAVKKALMGSVLDLLTQGSSSKTRIRILPSCLCLTSMWIRLY